MTRTWQLSLAVAGTVALGVLVGYLIAPTQEPQIVISDEDQELVNQARRKALEYEQEVLEEQDRLRAEKRAAERGAELGRELLRKLQSENGGDGGSSPD